jgi:branched-chain amino acid transport system substrate-binding protein
VGETLGGDMRRIVVAAALVAFSQAASAETIKIAFIDPLTGPFSNIGHEGIAHYQAAMDQINAAGGVLGGKKFELVTFDSKSSPQDSLIAFKAATDQGIHYLTQGNGSGVAAALIDAANKIAARDPERAVLVLNYASVDPDLTNAKCSFWHFRFDANTEQKMNAMTDFIIANPEAKKVYLINMDYAHGHQVAKYAADMLKRKKPSIEIVGNDLHPMGKVKDFSPYVSKIAASGADTVITGNWGNDLNLLIKAAGDAGLKVNFFTYYGAGLGVAAVAPEAALGHLFTVNQFVSNVLPNRLENYFAPFKEKNKMDFYYLAAFTEMNMLARAMEKAKSTDPRKVAVALEDLGYDSVTGEVRMRKEDHQILQPLVVSVLSKVDGKTVKFDRESTGFGWKPLKVLPMAASAMPTTCKMERP